MERIGPHYIPPPISRNLPPVEQEGGAREPETETLFGGRLGALNPLYSPPEASPLKETGELFQGSISPIQKLTDESLETLAPFLRKCGEETGTSMESARLASPEITEEKSASFFSSVRHFSLKQKIAKLFQSVVNPLVVDVKLTLIGLKSDGKTALSKAKAKLRQARTEAGQQIHYIRKHPREFARSAAETSVKKTEELPWIGQSVLAAKLFNTSLKLPSQAKRVESDRLLRRMKQKVVTDAKSTLKFLTVTGPKGLYYAITLPYTPFRVADAVGIGMTTQALAALSFFTLASVVLGPIVGVSGAVVEGVEVLKNGWKGKKLASLFLEGRRLETLSEEMEEKAKSLTGDEQTRCQAFAALYREEAAAIKDFVRSEKRQVAAQLIRRTCAVGANVSLAAAGACTIISLSGFGAPVCLLLGYTFIALSCAFFLADLGIGGGLWGYRKIQERKKLKEAPMPAPVSPFRSRHAQSQLGIGMRLALLSEIETTLQKDWNDSLDEEYEKPGIIHQKIMTLYFGDKYADNLKKRAARFREEISDDSGADFDHLMRALSEAVPGTDEQRKAEKSLLSALDKRARQEYDKSKGFWGQLTDRPGFKEWMRALDQEPLFQSDTYLLSAPKPHEG